MAAMTCRRSGLCCVTCIISVNSGELEGFVSLEGVVLFPALGEKMISYFGCDSHCRIISFRCNGNIYCLGRCAIQ